MVRLSSSFYRLVVASTLLLWGASGLECALAQGPGGGSGDRSRAVYQRRGFDHHGKGVGKHRRGQSNFYFNAPAVSSGWFQRPYPYHLDYYRMKYGGSYAPYFGNLYGPPQVVTAPPYFGPYYGGFDSTVPYGFNAPIPFGQRPAETSPYAARAVVDEPVAEDSLEGYEEEGNDEVLPPSSF